MIFFTQMAVDHWYAHKTVVLNPDTLKQRTVRELVAEIELQLDGRYRIDYKPCSRERTLIKTTRYAASLDDAQARIQSRGWHEPA